MTILLPWTSHCSLTMSLSKYINAPAYLLLSGSSGNEDIASDLLWVINTQNHQYIPKPMVALHVTHPKKHYPPVLNNEIKYFDIVQLAQHWRFILHSWINVLSTISWLDRKICRHKLCCPDGRNLFCLSIVTN